MQLNSIHKIIIKFTQQENYLKFSSLCNDGISNIKTRQNLISYINDNNDNNNK